MEDQIILSYKKLWLIVGYSLVLIIIYASLMSDPVNIEVRFFDKYAHTLSYFALMGWFVQIYHSRKALIVCAILFVCLGVGLEFVQGLTGYRQFDIYDMLANTLGVLIAWLAAIFTPFKWVLSKFESLILRRY